MNQTRIMPEAGDFLDSPESEARLGNRLGRLLALWLVCRTIIWTGVTYLACANAPLDVVEMLFWGREWQWGYGKHPPLPAWLAEASWWCAGGSLVGVYFISYALLAVTVWAVWQLGRLMMPAREAFLAALCLEGVVFFTYWGHEFNNNIVLTVCWAMTILYVYRANVEGRLSDWLAAGACAGLGLLAKYTLAFLLMPMLAWMILEPRARKHWRSPGPYLAMVAMLMIFCPHLIWAAQHDWLPLSYARDRASATDFSPADHLLKPVNFLIQQLLALLPLVVVMALGLFRTAKGLRTEDRRSKTGTNLSSSLDSPSSILNPLPFLAAVLVGPLAIYLAMGFGMGMQLVGPWGMPIWVVLGLLLVRRLPPLPTTRRGMVTGLLTCNLGALAILVGQAFLGNAGLVKLSRTQFPGQKLAAQADQLWRENCAGPIPIVAGDNWMAGNIGLYAHARPHVCLGVDPCDRSPWRRYTATADDEKLHRCGGVLVWDAAAWGPNLPPELAARFPAARPVAVVELGKSFPPVGLAILSPGTGTPFPQPKSSP